MFFELYFSVLCILLLLILLSFSVALVKPMYTSSMSVNQTLQVKGCIFVRFVESLGWILCSVLKAQFKNNGKSSVVYRCSKGHSRKVRGAARSLARVGTHAMPCF